MGDYSKRLSARLDGWREGIQGVTVTTDLTLTIYGNRERLSYELTHEEAADLGRQLLALSEKAAPCAARPVARELAWSGRDYPVVLCSGAPLLMQIGGHGTYSAVWDFSPGAVDLSPREIMLLWEHKGAPLGFVRDLRVHEARELRGMAYFSETPEAQRLRRDVDAGLVTAASMGATVQAYEPGDAPGVNWRITKWRPHELSLCRTGGDPNARIHASRGEG